MAKAQSAVPGLSNAELAETLRRQKKNEFVIEAARRLEKLAIEKGECTVCVVYRDHTKFAKKEGDILVKWGVLNPDVATETLDVYLDGEPHKAVDMWGQVVIVQKK